MENLEKPTQPPISKEPSLPDAPAAAAAAAASQKMSSEQRKFIILAVVLLVFVLAGIVIGVYFLLQPATDTAKIRDVFIIFMALETLLIGIALVILMVQLARLINLLQNEIRPIMETTQDTIGHLRGTTMFLSNNLVEPVVKMNEYLAGLSQLLQIIGLGKKSTRHKTTKGE